MSGTVNGDLRVWEIDLIRFAQQNRLLAVPPPPETVLGMPPLPAFGPIAAFYQSWGDVLNLSLGAWRWSERQPG